jgi:hypothetical protein
MATLLEGKPLIEWPNPAPAASNTGLGKAPKQTTGGYSLADLCRDAGMDPGEARKRLRQAKVEKPGSRWEWPSAGAAAHLLVILK